MGAINGVKKSAIVKKKKRNNKVILLVISMMLLAALLVAIWFMLFWKYSYREQYTDMIIDEINAAAVMAYVADREILAGEYVEGAAVLTAIPETILNEDLVLDAADLTKLRASRDIPARSLITFKNAYDPVMQNPVLDKTRIYNIDYLDTPGVVQGDYIDIRLKVYQDGAEDTYRDFIVCSKIEILHKQDETGVIEVQLSESDILNLNSAVIEATSNLNEGEIYVGRYVDPANQPKAIVDYDGAGIVYTAQELKEAQLKLAQENIESVENPVMPEEPQTPTEASVEDLENLPETNLTTQGV